MKKIKEIKPSYTVCLNDIQTLSDIDLAWAYAKIESYLTQDEITAMVEDIINTALPSKIVIYHPGCENCKKPWYKRFWNWLKKPFTKSK